ncbi:MAG: cysteine hydrolase [Nitrospiraceae bacterium]|nr:cysteine hydrolase [Nitrospiraceae bacterium]MDA8090011.1 cysteine hydrolase [Nitrospiraceae bacterium]
MKKADGIIIHETIEEIADPAHSCLVVWDVQNGLVDRIFNKDEFLSNLASLLKGLRGKMPVVYTLITPPPMAFRSPWHIFSMMRRFHVSEPGQLRPFLAPGTVESEIPEAVKPQEGDVLLDKPSASIFIGTNFENMMRARGITTLLFTGIATEYGVESSARDASNRGFYPVVVEDCVSSMDRDAHERSLANMEKLVIVSACAEILRSVGVPGIG